MASMSLKQTMLVTLVCACSPRLVSPKPPVITDSDQCAVACSHMALMGCEEGKPVSVGAPCTIQAHCGGQTECVAGFCSITCEQFCRDTQEMGVWLAPGCVAKATSCSAIEKCALGED